jgi:hypothetical protein
LNIASDLLHLGNRFTSLFFQSLLAFLKVIRLIAVRRSACVGPHQTKETHSHQSGRNRWIPNEPPGETCTDRKRCRRIGSSLGLDVFQNTVQRGLNGRLGVVQDCVFGIQCLVLEVVCKC